MVRASTASTAPGVNAIPDYPGPGPLSKRFRGGWIIEFGSLFLISVFHEFYRNWVMGGRAESLRNAKLLMRVEQWLGVYHEEAVQRFFLGSTAVVVFLNVYYSTAHFLVPIIAAVYLYRKAPARFVRWRNVFLFILFVSGPIGWGLFPITPPKYMPEKYGFVDTQVKFFNLAPQAPISYGFDGEPLQKVINADGNLYSGMPSHHISWAVIATLALWGVVRRRWVKGLLVAHLVLTSLDVLSTANHRFLDYIGSILEIALAYAVALAIERALARRRAGRYDSAASRAANTSAAI